MRQNTQLPGSLRVNFKSFLFRFSKRDKQHHGKSVVVVCKIYLDINSCYCLFYHSVAPFNYSLYLFATTTSQPFFVQNLQFSSLIMKAGNLTGFISSPVAGIIFYDVAFVDAFQFLKIQLGPRFSCSDDYIQDIEITKKF